MYGASGSFAERLCLMLDTRRNFTLSSDRLALTSP